MARFNKHLTAAALIAAVGAAGTALAQTAYTDPQDTPQTSADAQHGAQILHFKDQGNSPETDPAAHLLLIKDVRPDQAALVTTTVQSTTVADATPAPAPVYTAPAPSADTSATTTTTTTDTGTSSTTDAAPMPAPRADRN